LANNNDEFGILLVNYDDDHDEVEALNFGLTLTNKIKNI